MFLINLIIFLITSTNAQFTINQFNELCSTKHPDQFDKQINIFKTQYKKSCPSGMYFGSNGTNILCMKCKAGNYIRNEYICCNCGIGSISTEDNSKECTECEQKYGANKDNTKCELCPVGMYSSTKGSGCLKCGKGKYTEYEGSTYCLNCPKGEGVNSIGNGCEKCPMGTYSNEEGIGCLKCNNGSITTTIGSTKCQPCPAGTGANKERTQCQLCTPGMVSEKEGSGCHFCPNGKFTTSFGNTTCQDCSGSNGDTGYFESSIYYLIDDEGNYYWKQTNIYAIIVCYPCLKGHYIAGKGNGCIPCSKGSVALSVSSFVCTPCPKGYGPNSDRSVCIRCSEGQYSKQYENGYHCDDCGIGSVSYEGSIECKQCPAGKGRNSKGNECIECEIGYYSPEEGSGCLKCPYGTYNNETGSTSCTKCGAGYGSNYERSKCEICPKGYYSPSEGSECLPCENNTYSIKEGSISCEICPYGSGINIEHTFCNKCPKGTYSNEETNGLCIGCGNGAIVKEGENKCTKCKSGYGSNQEGNECIECSPGYYSSEEGKGCFKCEENTYSSTEGNTKCELCPQGTYSKVGLSKCENCPLGYYSPGEGQGCIQCDSGSYSNELNATECKPCQKGYGSNEERTQCEICQPGYYSDKEGSGCIQCPENTFTVKEGSFECRKCPKGYGGTTDRTGCEICQPGFYSPTEGSSCLSCPTPSYTDIEGATECKICSDGYTATLEKDKCEKCLPGRYSNSTTNWDCLLCPGTTYSGEGFSKCEKCPVGTTSIQGSGCFTCYPGQYSTGVGSLCYECPKNTYSTTFGATECLPCPDGMTTGGSVGQTSCKCSLGCEDCLIDFDEKQNKTVEKCISCLPGYALLNGKCSQCNVGYFSEGGMSVCEACPITQWSLPGRKECYDCTENCKYCDKSGGICLICNDGYSLSSTLTCRVCPIGKFMKNGTPTTYICHNCPSMTYADKEGTIECKSCDSSCTSCDRKTGKCTTCKEGWILNEMICSECPSGSYANGLKSKECIKCPKGEYQNVKGQSKCIQCPKLQYQDLEGSIKCKQCSLLCKTGCNPNNGHCDDCKYGYELNKETGKCDECKVGYYSDYSTNNTCLKCPKGTYCSNKKCTRCEKCYGKTYSSNEGSSQCSDCDSSCKMCDHTNGKCLSCPNGYGISSDGMKCEKCKPNEYSNNNQCHSCPSGLTSDEGSSECKGNQEIPTCPEINTIPHHYECVRCNKAISNCIECSYNSTENKRICTKCYSPYEINQQTNECELCKQNYHYSSSEMKCVKNKENCEEQIEEKCQRCKIGYILTQGECIKEEGECHIKTSKTCEECTNSNQMTTSGICKTVNNCEYSFDNKCLKCKNGYENKNGECMKNQNCSFYNDNHCLQTKESNNYIDPNTNEIKECIHADACRMINGQMKIYKCSDGYYRADEKCYSIQESQCKNITDGNCLKCDDEMHLEKGICKTNNITDCKVEVEDKCIECKNNKILLFGKCFSKEELHCQEFNTTTIKCEKCDEQYYYKDKEGCLLRIATIYENCKNLKTSSNECLECNEGYIQSEGHCYESSNQLKLKGATVVDNCEMISSKGCVRCNDGYYLMNNKCIQCNPPCEKCINATYCTGCNVYSNLVDNTCVSMNSVIKTCDNLWPNNQGCINCKDGYYKTNDGKTCEKCNPTCKTCFNKDTCLTCVDNYFKIQDSSEKLCKPFNESIGCINMTQTGCIKCKEGMYLQHYECQKCPKECLSCFDQNYCQLCQNDYVLKNKQCIHYNQIDHCKKASNSQCQECDDGYNLNDNKNECIAKSYLDIIIGVSISGSFIIIVVIVTIITIIVFLLQHKKDYQKWVSETTMKISEMNTKLANLNETLVANKTSIDFTSELNDIEVNKEYYSLITIGNVSKYTQLIQFTTKDKFEKYQIRVEPPVISLKKGYATEFSICIKTFCTIKLKDEIVMTSIVIKNGKQTNISIPFSLETLPSARLDPDELIQEKQLGEGAFGVVHLGSFRGNKVAIKKMKNMIDIKRVMEDFEREVAMLDKLRNDYLIHFYGACFVPGNICMVTEYAPFGSLQDILIKGETAKPRLKIRTKILIDCAKGIEYLHSNGILHRDIKPANFLVLSLEDNVNVNAKLTDFGSARNVNMLMTNISFTKGIGTPKYMAPEILNRDKYKMPADIYSFAITILEIINWKEVFTQTQFKFPWDIANYISKGKRPHEIEEIQDPNLKRIIEMSWNQNPKERFSIEDVVSLLETIELKFNQ